MPESLGLGPMGLKNLVATTASRRRPLQRLAQNQFGAARCVGVGRVKEVDAGIEGQVDDALSFSFVRGMAEGHRAQADFRHFQTGAAHTSVLHALPPCR